MKIIIAYSGGKDSQASLLWAVKEYGAKNIEALFCDTGWEHPVTYKHIEETTMALGVKLVTIRSSKYDGFVDMAQKKGRFPSTKARFCTDKLKSEPMNDYVLSHKEHLLILQGIRAGESFARSKMANQCTYWKFYFEPYKIDKDDKPVTFTYRKKDVIAWCKEFNADILRPVFTWTAQQVIDYIVANGQQPNPLYSKGFSRVGCFPCIMARHQDIRSMIEYFPEMVDRLAEAERSFTSNNGRPSSFFVPNYIPKKNTTNGHYPSVADVVKYLKEKNATGDLFDENQQGYSCSSYFGLCE
jgi:3'-phosphoadenosine 5'-phosphosulfate sulfotransferase (PAPS reductase)/FAD synthetase